MSGARTTAGARGDDASVAAPRGDAAREDRSAPGSATDGPIRDGVPRGALDVRRLGWLLVVAGLVGVYYSGKLAIERYESLKDPDYVPSCNFSVFVSCGPAMDSWQGSLLGFPNPLIGVGAFPVVVTTGVLLLAGLRLPRWYWRGLLAGAAAGMGLVLFLVYTSLHELGVLCPYCMVVWAMTLPVFVYVLAYCRQEGHLGAPARPASGLGLARNRLIYLAFAYLVIAGWVLAVMGDDLVASLRLG